jgi:glutathionylspermidine synthase
MVDKHAPLAVKLVEVKLLSLIISSKWLLSLPWLEVRHQLQLLQKIMTTKIMSTNLLEASKLNPINSKSGSESSLVQDLNIKEIY